MKAPLKKCVIAMTGDFGKDRTHETLKRWIECNGGKVAKEIDSQVTHLLCTRHDFRKPVKMVKQALNYRKIKIVNYDWLEDSLLDRSPKRPKDYLLRREVKALAKAKAKRRRVRKENLKQGVEKFQKGCEEFKEKMHTGGYHVYHDSTGFGYDVILARADLTTNKNERYNLKLYETHVAPFFYSCYANYSSPCSASATHVLAPIGSSFEVAMGSFAEYFKLKTKQEWNDRLNHVVSRSQDAFKYFPPEPDQPAGSVLEPNRTE